MIYLYIAIVTWAVVGFASALSAWHGNRDLWAILLAVGVLNSNRGGLTPFRVVATTVGWTVLIILSGAACGPFQQLVARRIASR